MTARRVGVVFAITAACGGGESATPVDGSPVDAAPAPGELLGTFDLTYYWVAAEADFPGAATVPLYDPSCGLLDTVSVGFADSLDLEGSGRLEDGRLLGYEGSCGCPRSPCYHVSDAAHPWGTGVQNRPLVPFRSVAVDPAVVSYGTPLWIVELEGLALPGEAPWGAFVHDGCVTAVDTGGAIDGAHLDWFVGLRSAYLAIDGELGITAATVHAGGDRCAPP